MPAADAWPKAHPETKLFPLMSKADVAILAEDIREHGLLEPIVLYKDKIVDGRNRLRACHLAKVQPRFIDIDLGSMRVVDYVLSKNLRRRQLTTVHLALLALDVMPYYKDAALARKRRGRAGMLPEEEAERGKTAERVADVIGISADTVRRMVAIEKVDPEVIELMRRGVFDSVRKASIAAGLVVSYSSPAHRPVTEDRWAETFDPVASYLRNWLGRPLPIDEETRRARLRQLKVLLRGLKELETQLADRSSTLAA